MTAWVEKGRAGSLKLGAGAAEASTESSGWRWDSGLQEAVMVATQSPGRSDSNVPLLSAVDLYQPQEKKSLPRKLDV